MKSIFQLIKCRSIQTLFENRLYWNFFLGFILISIPLSLSTLSLILPSTIPRFPNGKSPIPTPSSLLISNFLNNFLPESEILHSQLKERFEKLCAELKDEQSAECVFYNVFHQCSYDSGKVSLFIEQGENALLFKDPLLSYFFRTCLDLVLLRKYAFNFDHPNFGFQNHNPLDSKGKVIIF